MKIREEEEKSIVDTLQWNEMQLQLRDYKQTINRLESQVRELEEFIKIITDDLQEPLRTIIGFTDLLSEEYTQSKNETSGLYVNYIAKNANRMNMLIEGLSKYNTFGKNRKTEKIDSNVTVRTVIEELYDLIQQKEAVIEVAELPTVIGYLPEFRLLFQYLISRSLNLKYYSKKPKINIEAAQNQEYWEFSIRDNGIGMESYFQNNSYSTYKEIHFLQNKKNQDIGMSLSRKIVNLHQGTLKISKEEKGGSTYIFTIKMNLGS